MTILFSFISGIIFGLGLLVAGMANPQKVLGFLDIAGNWDPSLALVMVGAIAIASVAFFWMRKRQHSLLGCELQIPKNRRLDRRLILGSALFGIGWGIAGICPGPAWVLAGEGMWQGFIFVVAMLGGMILFEVLEKQKQK